MHSLPFLKCELQCQLKRARPVSIDWLKERIAGKAHVCSSRIARSTISIASDCVVRLVALRRIIDFELSVVKDIERLRTELQELALANLKILKERHIEIPAVRVIDRIASRSTKSKSAGDDKG